MITNPRYPSGRIVLGGAFLFVLGAVLRKCRREYGTIKSPWTRSLPQPIHQLPEEGPCYPRDAIPGGRNVETPYGIIRVYEWGPEDGEKALLLHGVSAPVLTMSSLADELALKGYRVLIFDLFGRGYSENLAGHDHDMQLYTTQILLALASSPLSWLGNESFHLIGYSFGGALAAGFTRFFPDIVKSLTLIAPGGLIRQNKTNWKQKLLYSTGIFPEWLLQYLVRKHITPPPNYNQRSGSPLLQAEGSPSQPDMRGGHDVTGGDSFDSAGISKFLPGITVEQTMAWQIARHPGFIPAFMSSLRHAPIFEQRALWSELSAKLRARKSRGSPLCGDKVLFVLGRVDPVIIGDELRQDSKAVLGGDLVEYLVMDAGHEIVMTKASEISAALSNFWKGHGL
ncbi:hypothetical protein jhhlp_005484 [Lomentospora prolificans]|uniref:AB hydrolase-1 domain-containing protein n=1 Tax=Lomentospora prolificans TaxID=41688 RepID=A0A2N3N724_9PEZI|nr:hypothetical protein jhhlp_005484 [Lomentospora prolificans]